MLPEKEACLTKVGSGTLTRTGAGITVRPPCSDTNGACGILLLPLSLVSVNIRGLLFGILATLVGRMGISVGKMGPLVGIGGSSVVIGRRR